MFCRSRGRIRAIILIFGFLSASAGAADALTLGEAQDLAIFRSAQLIGNKASVAAARQMASAAGQLPDPVLKLGVENLPINGPDRLSLTRDFMTMRRIGLSQEIPRAEKRQLRSERFEKEAVRMVAESQLNIANIRRETAIAWVDRYYAQQTRDVVLNQVAETKLQAQTAESGYAVGRNSQADVFAARTALVMLEDKLSQIDKQERNATLMLTRWVGIEGQRPVIGAPAWQSSHLDGDRLSEHFQNHPDLVMLRAQVDAAETEAQLAQANKSPDWNFEVAYSHRGSAYSNMISFGVSVPLQWDQKNRQDRELAAKLALVDEAQAKYEETLQVHDAEVRGLLNEWNNGKLRVARYKGELIPFAKQRTEASLTGYRTGKSDLASALSARRDEVDTRIQALNVEMETARAWAQLNFLIPDHNVNARNGKQP